MLTLPDKSRIASLDIHAQKTFTPLCPHELPVEEGHLIVEALNHNATLAAYRIGVKEAHHDNAVWIATETLPVMSPVEGENVDIRWPAHSIVGTEGFELIPGLPRISDYDYYVWQGIEKDFHPYGVCYHDLKETLSTGIIEFLSVKQVSTVLVGGLATDYCVKVSVLQLCSAGFEVIVNLSACRGVSQSTTDEAIELMSRSGARILKNI